MNTQRGAVATSEEQMIVKLPVSLLSQIDAYVGGYFTSREDFIRAATRHYVQKLN